MLVDTKLGMNLQKAAQVHDGLLQQHLVFTTGKTLFLVLSEAQRYNPKRYKVSQKYV